ncbi:AMP-binding protein [Parasedimentitalea maritima]|nr:AMP-binding protein [Zongyanglinia marina]
MTLQGTFPTTLSSLIDDGLTKSSSPLWVCGTHVFQRDEARAMINQFKNALIQGGLSPQDRVVIHGVPSPHSIAFTIAAILEGLVVVPLDMSMTPSRKTQALALANPDVIVDFAPDQSLAPGIKRFDPEQTLLRAYDTPNVTTREQVAETEACYIFFTSGTTGTPKAVLGQRNGLTHFLKWQRDMLLLSPTDRVGLLTRFSFDVVLRDILLPLVSGCTSVIPETDRQMDARSMIEWIRDNRISLMHSVPSVANAMLSSSPQMDSVTTLRHTLFAGEPLNNGLVERWRERFPQTEIHNLYGPTETTLAKFHARVQQPARQGIQACGHPLPGTEVSILSERGQRLQPGELGEVAIRTPHASLGYLDNQHSSGLRSIMTEIDSKQFYLTGDLGFLDENSTLHLRGRKDDQVKVMGVRLELAGIAASIELHPAIDKAIVLAEEDGSGHKRLLAWYQANTKAHLPPSDLRAFLTDHLPPAGIPGRLIACTDIPLNSNGKVDRARLPTPCEDSYVLPASGTETIIAEAIALELGVSPVGAITDFFALGGDSLMAAAISAKISVTTKRHVTPSMFLEAPTPRELAQLIDSRDADVSTVLPTAPATRTFALTPQQTRYLRTFVAAGNRNWCNMVAVFELPDHVTGFEVYNALHDISLHHDSLRLAFEIDEHGVTQQSIRPNSCFALNEQDLSNQREADVEAQIFRLKIEEAEKPIDIYSEQALFRAQLLHLPHGRRKLLWNVHHLVCDGTSQGILAKLLNEWLTNSRSFRDQHADLPSFRDLAYTVNKNAKMQISDHFPNLLKQPSLYRHIYFPNTQSATDTQRCQAFEASISAETMGAVRSTAKSFKCTPYVVLLAGYFQALSSLTKQNDLAIVTPLSGREHPQARDMIADLINLIPHRIADIDKLDTPVLLQRVRNLVASGACHQAEQFDQVVDALALPFPADRNPLTGLSLNYMPQRGEGLPASRVHEDRGYKLKYDVLFLMRDYKNCLNIEIQYRAGLFDRADIEEFFDLYEHTLREISNDA